MDVCKRMKASCKIVKYVLCVLLPFLLLPLALKSEKESRCLFVVTVTGAYWILEPVHMAATSLLPVVLFPLLGVLSSAEVSASYMSESMMMFIGGLIVAVAIENSKLHERMALKMLLLVGTRAHWLMFGLMLSTMFLSMWVNNTATAAMMIPIVEAIVEELSLVTEESEVVNGSVKLTSDSSTAGQGNREWDIEKNWSHSRSAASLKTVLLLSVVYSANLGGTGTLTGNITNLILFNILEATYPDSDEITYVSWMAYNVPGMLLSVFIGWLYLYFTFLRARSRSSGGSKEKGRIQEIIRRRYEKLGSISFEEAVVTTLFLLLVTLWIFRKPKFTNGWEDALGLKVRLGGSVVAIGVAFLLFLIPKNPRNLTGGPVLEWKTAQIKLPWWVMMVVGAGVTLAKGAKNSGLSREMAKGLSSLNTLHPTTVIAVACFITAAFTEVFTNTAVANLLLPVIDEVAISMKVNPIFFMLPVVIASSYAFMLPIASGPNSIAFDSGQMKVLDMAKPGFAMNLFCCGIQVFMIKVLGVALFNLNQFPEWAMAAYNATMMNNGTSVSHTA